MRLYNTKSGCKKMMPVSDTDEAVERNLMILDAMMKEWEIKMNWGENKAMAVKWEKLCNDFS